MLFFSIRNQILIIVTLVIFENMAQSQGTSYLGISLVRKKLEKIPDTVFNKISLKYLDLGGGWVQLPSDGSKPEISDANHIKNIPEKICNLQFLEVLDLSFNDVKDLPSRFSELKNLKSLYLSYNDNFNIIKNLPVLKRLKKLTHLNLIGILEVSYNKEKIRKELSHIPKLWLELSDVPKVNNQEFKYKDSF